MESSAKTQLLLGELKGDPCRPQVTGEHQASLGRTVRAFKGRLAGEVDRVFGIPFKGAEFVPHLAPPSAPDIQIGRVFDSHLELIWFLIPMRIFGPLLERHMLKLLPWEAEKNLARLANQWAERLQAAIEAMTGEAHAFMEGELASLGHLVDSAPSSQAELQSALETIKALDLVDA